eukprot:gb/GFBE01045325.1/.p1 GENE.gb/GFBE01045325.1/~~gb/GFBE01045325.1/.p1  ORF type:complete len:101 (+),score=28.83 gb/GFBE01045325.1/:1-303(+)
MKSLLPLALAPLVLLPVCSVQVSPLSPLDLPRCNGTFAEVEDLEHHKTIYSCEDVPNKTACSEYYTRGKEGGIYMQCGKAASNCLATGPECLPASNATSN